MDERKQSDHDGLKKEAGNDIYVVGKFEPVFGGSHFGLVTGNVQGQVPTVHEKTPKVYKTIHSSHQQRAHPFGS